MCIRDRYYVERSIAARDGTWKQQDTWHGLKEGMVAMAPYNSAMGSDLVKEVEQLQKDLASGKPIHLLVRFMIKKETFL